MYWLQGACNLQTSIFPIFFDDKSFTWQPAGYAIRYNLEWSNHIYYYSLIFVCFIYYSPVLESIKR